MTTARALAGVTKTSLRVLAAITCLSVLPLMVGLTGCASDRHTLMTSQQMEYNRMEEHGVSQSTEQRIEESRTAERVREALAAGADYRYDGVKVIAFDGGIQLSGFVKTSAQKHSAGEVASKVAGVKSVENNLTVKD